MFNLYAHPWSFNQVWLSTIVCLVDSVFRRRQLKGFHSLYPTFKDARIETWSLACGLLPASATRTLRLSSPPVSAATSIAQMIRLHHLKTDARKNLPGVAACLDLTLNHTVSYVITIYIKHYSSGTRWISRRESSTILLSTD
jgi:hypothetical protein